MACLAILTSCENVDPADRFIPLERPLSQKNILVEEFTGAKCVNCPEGAATIAALHEVYGDQIIAVSLYPSQMESLTKPLPMGQDLRTSEATDIFSAFDGPAKGLPAASFDRQPIGGSVLQLTPSSWGGAVYDILMNNTTSPVDITLGHEYDPSTRELNLDYTVIYNQAVAQPVTFQFYLVENGIVSAQITQQGIDMNYVNNHVLRQALFGIWGKELDGTHIMASTSQGQISISLPVTYVAENCQVIGFVADKDTHRVLQAELIHSITD